jgi:phosphoglycolate phosphatase
MTGNYELVVWDFDGTLADTRTAILAAADHAMASHGYPAPGADEVSALVGLPIRELYTRLAGDPGEQVLAALAEAHRTHFESNAAAVTTTFSGIEELLVDLRSAGCRSAVATSRTRRTLGPLMEHLELGHHFAALRTDDSVANPKPAPDMVLELCAELGVAAGDTILVGDTAFDIEMGRRAGATTCGVTWGNHGEAELEAAGADHVIHDVRSLAALLFDTSG